MAHCQVCGRTVRTTKSGGLIVHHVRGAECLGSGHPPIESSDARLKSAVEIAKASARRQQDLIEKKRQQRVYFIDPLLIKQEAELWIEASRLSRRLKRHLSSKDRFLKQMETHGYGDPPPAYL